MNEAVPSQEEAFRFLADPATHGLKTPVGRVDTAGAVVFLAGDDVYKIKRAVTFPFMDLSTLEKRREACEAEIAVNRENAPGVYLEAAPIVRTPGGLAIGGEGEAIEWVCHMRRFDENATLDRIADRDGLSDSLIDRLALAIRRSHARAPLRDGTRAANELETYIEQNDAAFALWPDLFPPAEARRLTRRVAARLRGRPPDAAEARARRFRPARPWRPASRQYRADRRRAGPVRCGGVLRRDRQRRRALRSRLPADGPRSAKTPARREQALQPLSGGRTARRRSPDFRRCRCL